MFANPWLRYCNKFYNFFVIIGSNLQSLFLLYMRATWGHQLFLLGISDLKNMHELTLHLTKYGFPAASFHAHEFAWIEMIGGVLLFFGFFSRIAALCVIAVTTSILSTVHSGALGDFQFVADPLILLLQKPYPFLMLGLLVFIFGPGRLSFDAWIKRWISTQPKY